MLLMEEQLMKHRYAVIMIVSTIASFGLGVFAARALRVLDAPPAYFVTLFDMASTAEVMKTDYPSLAPATFQPFGGHYIIHSGRTISFDGEPPKQIVVIAFDSMERLQEWHGSEAFRKLYDLYKSEKVKAFAVEGVTPGTVALNSAPSGD